MYFRSAMGAVFAIGLLASCASAPANDLEEGSVQAGGFWDQNRLQVQGLEADPPSSMEDLSAKSDVVVIGSIASVTKGKSYDQGGFIQETINVTISPTEVSGDLRDKPLIVEWDRPVEKVGQEQSPPPGDKYIFFLDHHPDYETLICASTALCVIAVDDAGTVTSPRSPERISEMPIKPDVQPDIESAFDAYTSN